MTQDNVTPPSPGSQTPPPPPPGAMVEGSGGAYPAPYAGPAPDADSKTMGMLAHLLAIFTSFIGPLIIWMMKKDTSPFVDDQGKESLNFQLTVLIAWVASGLLACLAIGFVLMPAVWVVNLIFCILATMKAKDGIAYRYPFALRLIK